MHELAHMLVVVLGEEEMVVQHSIKEFILILAESNKPICSIRIEQKNQLKINVSFNLT